MMYGLQQVLVVTGWQNFNDCSMLHQLMQRKSIVFNR